MAMVVRQEDATYRVVKDDEGRNYFYCLAPECNGLRRRRCQDFNSHRQMVHSWDPITLRVGAPPGPNYKVRSESFLKKERDRKNYNIEYQFKKRRNRIENVAVRAEIRKAGVKSAKELSIQALDRIKECVSAFDAQSAELREKIKNDIHKKIIRDKNWNVLRVMFDESPPMIEDEFSQPRIEAKSSQQRIGRQRNLAKMGQQNNHGGKQMRSLEPSIDEVRDPLGESIHDVDQDALCDGECSMPFPLSFVRSSRLVFDMKPHDVLPSVMGHHKYLDVKEEISKENATLLFNFKPGSNKLKVQLFKDVEIAPFLYDRLLAAYEKFPNNEEVFQYFAKMIYAELKEHMDLEHTNVQSKFFGVSKGCTYEQTEGHQTLGFKAPPPIVVPRPPRLDALSTDVESASSSASPSALATGDVIIKSVQATLSRVEVPSRERSQSPCRQFPNFVDIPDEDLRQMDRLELEKYASKCRDICRDLLKIQCRGMGVSIERGFSVGTERGFNGGADDMNLEGCLDMDMTTSSHAHEIATDVVSGQSREAPCVDGLTLNLLDPQGTKEDSIDNVAHGI